MNLADWAESVGVNRHTAYRWFREGTLPVPAERVGRLILVMAAEVSPDSATRAVVYAPSDGWPARNPASTTGLDVPLHPPLPANLELQRWATD